MAIDNMANDCKTEPLLIISGHISRALEAEIITYGAGKGCDYILGWAGIDHHRHPLLILRTDSLLLLNLLWENRKSFLIASMSTYMPGMSAVAYLLWRYVHLEG